MRNMLKPHVALPTDHGSWVFLISPLLIGFFAAGAFPLPVSLFLLLGAFSAFLLRQPLSHIVKMFSGRRGRTDWIAAWAWSAIYSLLALLSAIGLVFFGYTQLLALALPGLLIFAWHLWLVSRREERRRPGVDVLASGALALAAPAAYGLTHPLASPAAAWLFALCWLQSAASIVHAFLRLDQRTWAEIPPTPDRFRAAWRPLLYVSFNLVLTALAAGIGWIAPWLWLPFALQWLEVLWGTWQPAVGWKPTHIGLRQLIVSGLFTLLFVLVWN